MISNGFIVLLLIAEFICKIFHINGNQSVSYTHLTLPTT